MADDLSTTIIESHSFKCAGVDLEENSVFSKENRPTVIVNVFGKGRTDVLCGCQERGFCNYTNAKPFDVGKYKPCAYNRISDFV
jgi:hypothetical protein